MIGCPPDDSTLQHFIAALETIPPRPHHTALLAAADNLVPRCTFQYAMTRGGWYRLGGVIRPDGTRVAEDLESWLESELEACDGELDGFLARHASDGLLCTQHSGRTHYFVARFGSKASDFIQLEIEELKELLDRALIDPEHLPADLPELTDPLVSLTVEPHAVGRPLYRFRRLTDIRQVVARQPTSVDGAPPLVRFMSEWDQSSAGGRGHFSDHWIVAVREHLDRYHNTVLHASPISLHGRKLKSFHWSATARGTDLSRQLLAFDRAAGYPLAWYFHMVAGALAPREVAFGIAHDLDAGFSYLSDRDISLLKNWLDAPYAV
ncbi:MAG: hypothetical protein ACLPXB_15715 [Thiobacillaceae bacterium]